MPLPTESDIKKTVERAIELPSCPVKKQHAIASRIFLEKKINEYITTVIAHYVQPTDKSVY